MRTVLLSGLGSGFAPFASGTWGSLVGAAIFCGVWLGAAAAGLPRGYVECGTALGAIVASILAVRWGAWAVERWGPDPKRFTLDEVAGQWVALLVLPLGMAVDLWSLGWVAGGQFLLFRFFDIVKLPPARQAERLPAGWGILTDDLIAGAFANIVGQLLWRLTPLAGWVSVTQL